MRFLLLTFLLAIAVESETTRAAVPDLELRQVVIRAPEAEAIGLTVGASKSDEQLVTSLWQSVKEGRATVISDVTGAVAGSSELRVSSGRHVWLPTENDQEFDQLFMIPVSYQEFFVGTSLQCSARVGNWERFNGRLQTQWKTQFSPRGPVGVKWPTSWLDGWDAQHEKHNGKAIHGWLDWHDLFEENITGEVWFNGRTPTLIGILPPGDQVWPGDDQGRKLDVFFAQCGEAGMKPLAPREAKVLPLPTARTLVIGIGIDSRAALALTTTRNPKEDAALLQKLIAKAGRGEARLHLFAASTHEAAAFRSLESTRLHQYPAEMPSIPSAWTSQGVGTTWTFQDGSASLHQDLAAPARSQWQMALDVPGAIMWMPRFRGFDITGPHYRAGTHLLSAFHIPEVMDGEGLTKDETILVFTQVDSMAAAAYPAGAEAEIIVFEVSTNEEADWQPADEKAAKDTDLKRYQNLVDRVGAGTATLAARIITRIENGVRSTGGIKEDYMTATEFSDPPRPTSPLRTRPTALDSLPVGSRWEIAADAPAAEGSLLNADYRFDHSTAKPIEPPLKEIIALFAANETARSPGAVHHQETWTGSVRLRLGLPLCLGTRKPPGVNRPVVHVAFICVRHAE